MTDYERKRAAQIERNQKLLNELGIQHQAKSNQLREPPAKRQKISRAVQQPSRVSARIATIAKPTYDEEALDRELSRAERRLARPAPSQIRKQPGKSERASVKSESDDNATVVPNLDSLRAGWSSWKPVAAAPSRDAESGEFFFEDYPSFTPNMAPAEMIREGAFGGSYFRPYKPRSLGIVVEDDWRELPTDWIDGLDAERFLTNPEYDPEVNKYRVSAGQSIEAWEAAGWIDHRFDIRGWFQWYCRFFQGRRCDDDMRQISRWSKCVGETGRWRRTLLKKYVAMGIRDVADEGNEEEGVDVSPVVHQTCHHWAYEIRQDALDRWWVEGR